MSLLKTNLVIVSAPLPADFRGGPEALQQAIVERLEIRSPVGTVFFTIGDVEPATNVGPWLKNGTKWYVWDGTTGNYQPQDISDSTEKLFTISDTEPGTPGSDDASIWLRTVTGRVIGWYFWTGTEWRPGGNVSPAGPTASRPTVPKDYEQYFDTDINTLIHWERGAWRTVSGTPGDVKFVTTTTLSTALTNNPGWAYLGASNQAYIGRVLGVAAKDSGATPESAFATSSGITSRAAGEMAGAETHTLTSDQIEEHSHLVGAATALNSNNDVRFYRVDNADELLAPAERPPNYFEVKGDGSTDGTGAGELPTPTAGTMLITSRQLTLADAEDFTTAAEPHNNIQPTLFLWALTKL